MFVVVVVLFGSEFWLLQSLFEPSDARAFSITSLAGTLLVLAIILSKGLFILQPNESVLLLFFGSYQGTVRQTGFRWTNPFCSLRRIRRATGHQHRYALPLKTDG
jgi:regulator of protease activity HflC (stomatin/prohibitin superfamily)